MNKSKILKILSLSTLGIGAISGVTVALTACNNDSDNTTAPTDLSKLVSGTNFTAITVNAGAKLTDLVAAINTAITAQYPAWTIAPDTVKVYTDEAATTVATDTNVTNGVNLFMIITAKDGDKNFTGHSPALKFTLTVSPKIDISKSNDDIAKITSITSAEKDLTKLNDAIVVEVAKIPALKGITSTDLKIDVKKGTTAAVVNDIVEGASLTFQLTAQGDKYTGSSTVITFTFHKSA